MNWPHEFRYVTITRDIFARIQVWDLRTGAARAKPLIRGGAFRRLIFRLFDIDTAWLETMMAQEMEGTYIAVAGKLSDRVRSRVLRLFHPEAAYSNTMATGK